jgi:hypothetical protein
MVHGAEENIFRGHECYKPKAYMDRQATTTEGMKILDQGSSVEAEQVRRTKGEGRRAARFSGSEWTT